MVTEHRTCHPHADHHDPHAPFGQKALCVLFSLALAMGLAPTTALATPDETTLSEWESTSPTKTADEGARTTPGPLESAEGQALVLYRTSAPENQRIAALSLEEEPHASQNDAEPLSEEGFEVVQTWDLSAVDTALANQPSTFALEDEGTDASTIPEGEDLRVALVSKPGTSSDDLVSQLEDLSYVEAAQPNYLLPLSNAAVNDTFYDEWQYNLHAPETSETTPTSQGGINIEAALQERAATGTSGKNVVAIIDTGVDYTNPDLEDAMWTLTEEYADVLPGAVGSHGYDYGDNDDDPMPASDTMSSHGTHCAGIVAAQTNNNQGVAGTSSDTQIMALKCSNSETGETLSASSVVSSYQYIIAAKLANVNVVAINGSWHLSSYMPVVDYLVNQAGRLGVLSLFAAGNYGVDTQESSYYGTTTGPESPYAIVVAASTEDNTYASFSNYNKTDVDVAFPGSRILSTVSTTAGAAFFQPLYSKASGKTLIHYQDFNSFDPDDAILIESEGVAPEDGFALRYHYVDDDTWTPTALTAQQLEGGWFTVEKVDDAGFGDPGLRVSIDTTSDKCPFEGTSPSDYYVTVYWKVSDDNVLLEDATTKGLSVQDYAYSSTPRLESGNSIYCSLALTDGANFSSANYLSESQIYSNASAENAYISGTNLVSLGDEGAPLYAAAQVTFGNYSESSASGTLCGVGLGSIADGANTSEDDNAYAPYGLMSGTSMATPAASGTVAQLAALYPNASALELRGMIVGSTTPIEASSASDKPTATNGRFTWDAVLNSAAHSANTWSAEEDTALNQVTVHGAYLEDARVSFDDVDVVPVSQDENSITFAVDPGVFDGERHTIAVTDASTGKTHTGAYTLSSANTPGTTLQQIGTLPESEGAQASGALVSADGTLFFACTKGTYLHGTTDPTSSEWSTLPGAGLPESKQGTGCSTIEYAYLDGMIYAFCTDLMGEDGAAQQRLYVNTFALDGTGWSGWKTAAETEAGGFTNHDVLALSATAYSGEVFCALSYSCTNADKTKRTDKSILVCATSGSTEFTLHERDLDWDEPYPLVLSGTPDGLKAMGTTFLEDQVLGMSYDLGTNSWKDLTSFTGQPELSVQEAKAFYKSTHTSTSNGLLYTAVSAADCTDTVLLDLTNFSWKNLGDFGLNSSGFVGCSAAIVGNTVYLAGNMATQGGDAGPAAGMSLYAFPEDASSAAGGLARTISAQAEGNGAATVETWRGVAGAQVSASLHDTVTWKATPAQGYAFDGWFAEDGTQVSTSAEYSMPVNDNTVLTARFSATSDPDPVDPGSGDPGSGGSESGDQESSSADASTHGPDDKSYSAKTNDDAAPFAAGALVLLTLSGTAFMLAVRRLKRS